MTPFVRLVAVAAPLLEPDIDTDIIIPSREIRTTGKTGLADGLFAGRRYLAGRTPNPDFILNRPRYAGAQILLGGPNFGSGSSREHAVWALAEYGFRAVVAPSFSPIFAGNCVRNGMLAAVLDAAAVAHLAAAGSPVTIDLPGQTVTAADGRGFAFAIDAEAKAMLLGGLDAIALTLQSHAAIAEWQVGDQRARPWIYLGRAEVGARPSTFSLPDDRDFVMEP